MSLSFLSSHLSVLAQETQPEVIPANPADTAWMLVSTALVLFMTPALAFFYGGLARSKNMLNTMMMSFIAMGFVGITWALLGYSLAFSEGNSFIGGLSWAFLKGVGTDPKSGTTIPHILFMAYQGTFAIITAALISGAVIERMRFGAYLAFITLWSLVVYAPVCHWVWGGGWAGPGDGNVDALDFAGGTVVHINAAAAALVAAIVVGKRKDFGRQALLPHNVPLVLLGAGALWFGWFGFNGGSAGASNASAAQAFVNTMFAPCATLVAWTLLDLLRTGKVTGVGCATAIVVGLVAVTPAAGFLSPTSAMALGLVAAFPSYFAIIIRAKTSLDDSLDVFAAHGLGGITGAVLTGVLAQVSWGGRGGLIDGNGHQVVAQLEAIGGTLVYSLVVSFILIKIIGALLPLKATDAQQGVGLDVVDHGEEAYSSGEGAVLILENEVPKSQSSVSASTLGAR